MEGDIGVSASKAEVVELDGEVERGVPARHVTAVEHSRDLVSDLPLGYGLQLSADKAWVNKAGEAGDKLGQSSVVTSEGLNDYGNDEAIEEGGRVAVAWTGVGGRRNGGGSVDRSGRKGSGGVDKSGRKGGGMGVGG